MAIQRQRRSRPWLIQGALAGLVGGLVMAVVITFGAAIAGVGFLNPLNAIGGTIFTDPQLLLRHTFGGYVPELAQFDLGRTLAGVGLHLLMSALLGVGLAWAFVRFRPRRALTDGETTLAGIVAGLGLWLAVGLLFGTLVDPLLQIAPPPPLWLLGHVAFAISTLFAVRALVPAGTRLRVTFAPAGRERVAATPVDAEGADRR